MSKVVYDNADDYVAFVPRCGKYIGVTDCHVDERAEAEAELCDLCRSIEATK